MREKTRLNHRLKIYDAENLKNLNRLMQEGIEYFVGPILTLDLTEKCNYCCPHCIDYRLVQNAEKRELDFEMLCILIKQLYEKGCRNLELTGGGEPTMYSKFEEFCRYASNLGYNLALVTNGSNIGKFTNLFKEIHFDWIRVSLDAITPKIYSKMHGVDGRFVNIVLENIGKISEYSDLGISYIMHEENLEDCLKTLKMVKKLKIKYFEIKPLRNKMDGTIENDILQYTQIINKLQDELKTDDIELLYPVEKYEELTQKDIENYVCWSSYLRTIIAPSGMYRCSYARGGKNANTKKCRRIYKV